MLHPSQPADKSDLARSVASLPTEINPDYLRGNFFWDRVSAAEKQQIEQAACEWFDAEMLRMREERFEEKHRRRAEPSPTEPTTPATSLTPMQAVACIADLCKKHPDMAEQIRADATLATTLAQILTPQGDPHV